ncbi:MAG: aminopeptidase [Pseudomonadota bacterium]
MVSVPKRLLLLGLIHCLSGCYYWQAAQGQWSLSRAKQPIPEVLAGDATEPELHRRLALVQEAVAFAHSELQLPDNGSYRHYVDLERGYVVVNVFAAPEFSLQPETWCYPFAGCLAYRGYFDEADARRKADALSERGLDVTTRRVPAYSTLGKLRDPVVSTMLTRSDRGLVSLIFHELAHQVIYVGDDTAFNESFATAVADIGLERWRESGRDAGPPVAVTNRALRQRLLALIRGLRADLKALYADDLTDVEKRARKAALFAGLAEDWQEAGARSRPPHNNAALIPVSLYNDLTPAFKVLYAQQDSDMSAFFDAVKRLGDLDRGARDAALAALMPQD